MFPLHSLFFIVTHCFYFVSSEYGKKVSLAPVYLTLSPLYREAADRSLLIDREVQIQWRNDSVDKIALYDADPETGVDPILEFNTLQYPEGFVDTNIPFGNPVFPGGWEQNSLEYSEPGDHCLPMWIFGFKNGQHIHSDCLKIRPTWMQDNRLSLENVDITSLLIPGTHNSGCYKRGETLSQRDISGRYILTQDTSVWQQLVYGIRYLDFRVGYHSQKRNVSGAEELENIFWINHDLIKVRLLAPILRDIKTFLRKTTQEIIILDFHRFPLGFSGRKTRHEQLIKLIERELKEYALVYKSIEPPTLDAIWEQGKRLIISYGENEIAKKYDWLWPPLRQLWGNKQTVDTLYEYLQTCMTNDSLREPTKGMWAAMSQMTPGPLDLLFNPKGSLRNMAYLVNRNLTRWLREDWWNMANIVATDFFLSTDIVNTAISVNNYKGNKGKHYSTS